MKILIFISFIFISCSNRHKAFHNIADSANNNLNPKNFDSLQNSQKLFKPIIDYPIIKDTSDFINQLIKQFNLEVADPAKNEFVKNSITFYKKIRLNGSVKDFILLEYDYGDGDMASFPWKYQFLFTEKGKLVTTFGALKFKFVKIFSNQNPFLIVLISTARGNGFHQVFKISADTLENIYDGYKNYKIQAYTYDAYEDNTVFEPHELLLSIKDINKDGYNDLEFNGTVVLIQGLTKDSIWYDNTIGNKNDTIRYSINHPFKKLPVHYTFLYDKRTEHFVWSEKYSKKYSF
ncbi:MAG TPA: hypothetical protein VIM07_04565 [Chitinophagaceae bacterium]